MNDAKLPSEYLPTEPEEIKSEVPRTPAAWFAARFPGLEERQGKAVEEAMPKKDDDGKPYVRDLSDLAIITNLRDALSAKDDPDPGKLKNNIRKAYGAKALDRASVDALAAKLQPITGRDFK